MVLSNHSVNYQNVMMSNMPIKIISPPAILCTTPPNLLPFFNMEPPAPKYQITKITIKRGIAVPMAKTPGKITPYVVEKVTGMSNIKNH